MQFFGTSGIFEDSISPAKAPEKPATMSPAASGNRSRERNWGPRRYGCPAQLLRVLPHEGEGIPRVHPDHAHAPRQPRERQALALVIGARLLLVHARRDVVLDESVRRRGVEAQLRDAEP